MDMPPEYSTPCCSWSSCTAARKCWPPKAAACPEANRWSRRPWANDGRRQRQTARRRTAYADAAFWLNKKHQLQQIRYVLPVSDDVEYLYSTTTSTVWEATPMKPFAVSSHAPHPVRGASICVCQKYKEGVSIQMHKMNCTFECSAITAMPMFGLVNM